MPEVETKAVLSEVKIKSESKKQLQEDKRNQQQELERKVAELQAELDLSPQEFEAKLVERLKEEVRFAKLKLEQDLKK